VVWLGLRFEKSGLELDRKIWQSAHLWKERTQWFNHGHCGTTAIYEILRYASELFVSVRGY